MGDNKVSSFWGNIAYVGKSGPFSVKIAIAGAEIVVRDSDDGLRNLRATSGGKRYFLVIRPAMAGLHEIVAIYGPAKADQRLVLSLREKIANGEATAEDLRDWSPDYLLKGFE